LIASFDYIQIYNKPLIYLNVKSEQRYVQPAMTSLRPTDSMWPSRRFSAAQFRFSL